MQFLVSIPCYSQERKGDIHFSVKTGLLHAVCVSRVLSRKSYLRPSTEKKKPRKKIEPRLFMVD